MTPSLHGKRIIAHASDLAPPAMSANESALTQMMNDERSPGGSYLMTEPDDSLESLLQAVMQAEAKVDSLKIVGRCGSGGEIYYVDFHCEDDYGNLSCPAIRAVKDEDKWYLSTYAGDYYIYRSTINLPDVIIKMLQNMTYCLTVPALILHQLHVEGPFDATTDSLQ